MVNVMEWLLAIGAVWLVLFAWFVRECRRAPLGYQDEQGFHEIESSGLEADLQRERARWREEQRERRRQGHRGQPA
jgi:type VI protein secretion system component VasK